MLDVCYCSQWRTWSTMCTMNITSYLSDTCALTIFIAQELLVLQCCGHTCLCLNFREYLCVCLRKFMWHFFLCVCVTDVRINTKNPATYWTRRVCGRVKGDRISISGIGLNIFMSCNSAGDSEPEAVIQSLEEIVLVILSKDKNQRHSFAHPMCSCLAWMCK